MNALDSSLEALPFNPVNLSPLFTTAFNNLWTLFIVVVTTAMISFRHLRSSSSAAKTTTFASTTTDKTVLPQATTSKANVFEVEEEVVLTRGCSKNNFTVYYYEEVENEVGYCVGDEVDGGDLEEEGESEVMTIKKWELGNEWTVKMRGGRRELGWYDFQDRRVIDGSVVRLWEGERERNCSSQRMCSSLGVTPFRLAYT